MLLQFLSLLWLPLLVDCGPTWRSYTSSSYYYTDYSIPAKHNKFVPGPQFCPDTGRTLCKAVKDYPEEHILQLVSSAKSSRRFNLSSVFVDEREGDSEPNDRLLPRAPPPLHDGYVVYQTAVHYDYHPQTPWHHPLLQQARRRRKPVIRRRQLRTDERPACSARMRFVPPQAALNDNSEWKFIVNLNNKNYKQIIRVDICESPGEACSSEISLPYGYTSSCKQKFIKKKLLALDGNGQGTSVENFFVPSCCVCHVSRDRRR